MSFLDRIKQWQMRRKIYGRVVGWAMSPEEVQAYFDSLGKQVLTFYGYSGMGYENNQYMLEKSRGVMAGYAPDQVVVNIGATAVGLGQIYGVAKEMGFETTGIVSAVALKYGEDISEHVDHICFVDDPGWGGFIKGTEQLSPTSLAMVTCSDFCVAIGGNEVSRDEILVARRMGKPVLFIPAEMNHEKLITKTTSRGLPRPTSFEGEVHELFTAEGESISPEDSEN